MSFFQSIGGVFTSPPEIVSWGQSEIHLFAFAVGTDQALWYAQLDGFTVGGNTNAWSGWRSLGGVVMSPPRAVRSGELSVDVFAVGARSELLHWQFRNGAWTSWPIDGTVGEAVPMASHVVPPTPHRNWESLGGILMSPPHAVMFGELNDMILVFALGTDHALWTRASVNGSWRDWDTFGRTLSSPPHAVTWRSETCAVFALGTDSAIWCMMGSDWHSLGGAFSSAPYAVTTFNHIHVFAADTQSELKHCSWDGNSWSNWESLGGILMSPPTANSFQNNELLHVYALGTDSAIWRRRLVGASWSDWDSLGGPFISPPSTVARLPDNTPTRDLVALGTDHAVWHLELFDP
jgi:hypothetical protein